MTYNEGIHRAPDRRSEERSSPKQYYSAEFLVDGLETPYQFKIWNMASTSLSVLVKENSDLVPWLRVGDTLKVKYYLGDRLYPTPYQKTAIRHITKNDQGRLRGHYLVGLEILENSGPQS